MKKRKEIVTSYYRWEGSACRIHLHPNGDLTADVYNAGQELHETSPTDVHLKAVQIGKHEYDEIVAEEEARHQRRA